MSLVLSGTNTRPALLPWAGGYVHIGVHDAAHFQVIKQWKQRLKLAHPDAGGSHSAFLRVHKQYKAWLDEERFWYHQYGMQPPMPSESGEQPIMPTLDKIEKEAIEEALRLCGTIVEAAEALGMVRSTFYSRAKRLGVDMPRALPRRWKAV